MFNTGQTAGRARVLLEMVRFYLTIQADIAEARKDRKPDASPLAFRF